MPFDPDAYINEKVGAKPFNPDEYISQKTDQPAPGTGSKILQAVIAASKKIDSYTGAPMRAGIAAAQDVGSLNPIDWAKAGGVAAAKQFGENPDSAATGEDIVKKAGIPEGMPAKVAGFGMDLAANPINFAGPVMGGAGKVLEASKEIPYAGTLITAATKAPGNLMAKGLSVISKPSEAAWHTYAAKTKQINDLLEKHGGEIAPMADEIKAGILSDIDQFKKGLSNEISTTLDRAASLEPDKTVSSQPILDALYRDKIKLNPHTQPADVAEIQDHINTLQSMAPNGQMSLKDLFDAKKYLQENGYSSVRKNGGLFYPGDAAQTASKQASGVANQILRQQAPEIAKANDAYSHLHDIQDKIGTLLKEGNSAPALSAAGGGTGAPGQTILRELSQLTGKNYIDQANTFFGAKAMNNPDLRTSLIRAGLTGSDAIQNSSVPARGYNAVQILGAPGSPIASPKNSDAVSRRLGSH